MVDKKILTVGLLIVTLLVSVIYVQMNAVKIRVDVDKSTFYTQELNVFGEPFGAWLVSGREYSSIFDGASKMNRRTSGIVVDSVIDEVAKTVLISRTTPYIRGPVIKESWFFDGNIDDVELFPIYHKVEVFNASGFFYRYEVRDLKYDGPTIKLVDNNMSFGLRMKVEWQDGFRWAWVYKTGILKVQYNILSDYEVYSMRLFDPLDDKGLIMPGCHNETVYYNETVSVYINITVNCTNYTWVNVTTTTDYNMTFNVSTDEWEVCNNCTSCDNSSWSVMGQDYPLCFYNITETHLEKQYYNYSCNKTIQNGTKNVTKNYTIVVCYPYVLVKDKYVVDYINESFNCTAISDELVQCDSCFDGNCDGVCDPRGGETCALIDDTVKPGKPPKYKNSVIGWDVTSGRIPLHQLLVVKDK